MLVGGAAVRTSRTPSVSGRAVRPRSRRGVARAEELVGSATRAPIILHKKGATGARLLRANEPPRLSADRHRHDLLATGDDDAPRLLDRHRRKPATHVELRVDRHDDLPAPGVEHAPVDRVRSAAGSVPRKIQSWYWLTVGSFVSSPSMRMNPLLS